MHVEDNMGRVLPLGANGTLTLDLGWRGGFQQVVFTGGPYDAFPNREGDFGVCVRAERVPKGKFDLNIPIRDFDVPQCRPGFMRDMIRETFAAALADKHVYIGCMGGWGRTGLFMALLAKAAGADDPVGHVRATYTPKAVETKKQAAYVEAFDVQGLPQDIYRLGWKRLFRVLREEVGNLLHFTRN